MRKQHKQLDDVIVQYVKENSGALQKEVCREVSKSNPDYTPKQIGEVLNRLAREERVFRTRNREKTHERGFYFVWSEPQKGVLADLTPITHGDKKVKAQPKREIKRRRRMPKADTAPPTVHPTRKPGTFTVNLELPSGKTEPFTLDEMMRMYSQLGRFVEAFKEAGL